MADFNAQTIKSLRETSGAGMLDCKKALEETGGDIEAAKDWLRKKGLATAAKKSGRVAAEGLIAIAAEGNKGAIIELNSETDFVAKNEEFQKIAGAIAGYALAEEGDIDKLKSHSCAVFKKPVADVITDAIARIGENLNLRRSDALEVKEGVIASYIHNAYAPNMGKIGVLVALESKGDAEKLQTLGKQIAMHIAAARPESVDIAALDPRLIEREKDVLADQARNSGKPEEIIEKMIEGRIRKFYEEVVLLEQPFVIDGKTKVSKILEEAEKDVGAPVKITGFISYHLGEGIEKEESDFASEVAAAANG